MAKVHLIYFDINTGPLAKFHHGLAYLIGTLRARGHAVSLSHLRSEDDFPEAIDCCLHGGFDVIGVSLTTLQRLYVRHFFEAAPKLPGLLVGGGVHCSLIQEKAFEEFPALQAVCIGEGEVPFSELCRRIDAKEDYYSTESLFFKYEGRVIKNGIAPLQELDALAFPDYSLFDCASIMRDAGWNFNMVITRGCPYSCTYCSNHAQREVYPNKEKYLRLPDPHFAITLIRHNLSFYPQSKRIFFNDDILTFRKQWLAEFAPLYKEEIGLPFFCHVRLETIDDDIADYLKKAGCYAVGLGIESGNEWLRKNILNRNYSDKEIHEVISIIKKRGINIFAYNMFGLPFETKKMAYDTLRFNIELQPTSVRNSYYFPFPGTQLEALARKYDLLLPGLEQRSGFLEGPAVKETFMMHAQIYKVFQVTQLFFFIRVLFLKVGGLSRFTERALLGIVFFLHRPLFMVCDQATKNRFFLRVQRAIFRWGFRHP